MISLVCLPCRIGSGRPDDVCIANASNQCTNGAEMSSKDLIHLSQLVAIQSGMDRAATNISNIGTPGYRAVRSNLEEYINKSEDSADAVGKKSSISMVRAGSAQLDFSQGSIYQTGSPLDVAVTDNSWFVISTPNGERYSRDGSLKSIRTACWCMPQALASLQRMVHLGLKKVITTCLSGLTGGYGRARSF